MPKVGRENCRLLAGRTALEERAAVEPATLDQAVSPAIRPILECFHPVSAPVDRHGEALLIALPHWTTLFGCREARHAIPLGSTRQFALGAEHSRRSSDAVDVGKPRGAVAGISVNQSEPGVGWSFRDPAVQ